MPHISLGEPRNSKEAPLQVYRRLYDALFVTQTRNVLYVREVDAETVLSMNKYPDHATANRFDRTSRLKLTPLLVKSTESWTTFCNCNIKPCRKSHCKWKEMVSLL